MMAGGTMVVTPLYAGVLALWLLVLALRVIHYRSATGIYLGDGGDATLLRAIRGQANFVEYVPLALLLLAILELSRFSIYLLHVLGVTLLIARLLHGYAFAFRGEFKIGRLWGASLTFLVLGVEAILCIFQAYRGHVVWFAT
jgi:uncharacterized membrane protein YecN with MAPEG domain